MLDAVDMKKNTPGNVEPLELFLLTRQAISTNAKDQSRENMTRDQSIVGPFFLSE